MARRVGARRSYCPIHFALEIFGDQWTLLLIRDILFKDKRTFGEFLDSEEKIATNILTDRLEWLEKHKIIKKLRDSNDRRKLIYRLTPKGIDLLPIMLEMINWSAKYDPKTAAPKVFVEQLKSDKEGLIKEILAAIDKTESKLVSPQRAKRKKI